MNIIKMNRTVFSNEFNDVFSRIQRGNREYLDTHPLDSPLYLNRIRTNTHLMWVDNLNNLVIINGQIKEAYIFGVMTGAVIIAMVVVLIHGYI